MEFFCSSLCNGDVAQKIKEYIPPTSRVAIEENEKSNNASGFSVASRLRASNFQIHVSVWLTLGRGTSSRRQWEHSMERKKKHFYI